MDVRHTHGTDVHVVRACYHNDGADLVAVGGAHSVEVLLVTPTSCKSIANFHLGTRTTALAWSTKTTSPSATDKWSIELAAAGATFGLFLLTKDYAAEEHIFSFGGGLSGHHGKVNDMTYCGGQSEDSARYLATVSDDKMLMVWDLSPSLNIISPASPAADDDEPPRAQPTAYVIAYPHPLTSVHAHPTTSKELLVADARGSIFLADWRTDPDELGPDAWRNSSVVELVEPRALADAVLGVSTKWSGSVSWRTDSADMVGAAYGPRFSIWDMGDLHGGKPNLSGISFPDGCAQFRWCPTYPDYFAISSASPARGAIIHVHNVSYAHASPTVFVVGARPLAVRSFDFLAARGIPRIVAGVGRDVVIFYIGVDS